MTVHTSCDVCACVAVQPHHRTRVLRNFASSFGLFALWVAPLQFSLATQVVAPSAGGEDIASSRAVEVNGRGRIQSQYLDSTAQQREAPIQLHSNKEIARQAMMRTDAVDSVLDTGSKRQKTGNSAAATKPTSAEEGVKTLEDGEFDGLTANACKNFQVTSKPGEHRAIASCPSPLKMAGCSCRDKTPEKSGACSTMFLKGEKCEAFTMPKANITAYVRCCNFKHILNVSIETSELSGTNDGDGVMAKCPENVTLLGCACATGDKQAGCKMTRVVATSNTTSAPHCEATNHNSVHYPRSAGVQAQALCAEIPFSQDWETVALKQHTQSPQNMSSGLQCEDETNEMISCSCGSSSGECGGGKVLGNKCECWGYRCMASARCAKIPVPPKDCVWTDWGEWSECSASCGAGTKSRVREVAMVAQYGGKECTGPTNHIFECEGEGTDRECALKIKKKVPKESGFFGLSMKMWAIIGGSVLLLLVGAALIYHHQTQKKGLGNDKAWGGGAGGEYGEYGSWGGYGEAQGGETQAGEEATTEAPAETGEEDPGQY